MRSDWNNRGSGYEHFRGALGDAHEWESKSESQVQPSEAYHAVIPKAH